MGLINEKNIVSAHAFPEKPFQMHRRIKHIIIVAYHCIHPQRKIQTHLKGTHLPLLGLAKDGLPVIDMRGGPQLINRIIDPVEMTFGIGTMGRITFRLLHKAELILGRDGHHLVFHAFFLKNRKSLLRHSSGNGLGSKVKNGLPFSLAHSADSRENSGHSFSNACRSLDEDLPASADGMVDASHHFPLAFPVRERKFQILQGFVSFLLPFQAVAQPLVIFIQKFLVPVTQIFYGKNLAEPFYLFGVQIGVGHLNSNGRQILLHGHNITVTHGLCLVNSDWLLQLFHISVDSLDLIDPGGFLLCENAVGPAFHLDGKILIAALAFQCHFSPVIPAHLLLKLAVESAAF